MPYLTNWLESESCLKKNTLYLPHFPSAGQPENMRALDTDRVRERVQMLVCRETSKNHWNKRKISRLLISGVPSTRETGKPVQAERWSQDMSKQVDGGKQTQIAFVPTHLRIKKNVRKYA
jgi:hypothetical protein